MDFPDQLIDAHGAGELVVFAGAGVSMMARTRNKDDSPIPSSRASAARSQAPNPSASACPPRSELANDAAKMRVPALLRRLSTAAACWVNPRTASP
jgi:hypothetical protein